MGKNLLDIVRIGSDGSPYDFSGATAAIYRASLIPTTSYVAGNAINLEGKYNQMMVLWGFTIGSLTSGQLKIEFSPDNITWYQETVESLSAGTSSPSLIEHSITATGNYRLAIPVTDRYIRISAKGTGTVTNSLVSIDVYLGINP